MGRGPATATGKPAATSAPAPAAPVVAVETPPVDMTAFLRFTVDDVWYAGDDLDRSMDLLAICRVDGPDGAATTADPSQDGPTA